MTLSKNFTLSELTKSQTATRRGIINEPDEFAGRALVRLAKYVLQPIRDHFGSPVIITSGFRCPELNRAIGSKDTSQHTKGEAVDFEIAGVDNLVLHNWIKKNLDFDQNILEFYKDGDPQSGWCHVSWKRHGNRQQTFEIG